MSLILTAKALARANAAYALGAAALPKAGGTMTGPIVYASNQPRHQVLPVSVASGGFAAGLPAPWELNDTLVGDAEATPFQYGAGGLQINVRGGSGMWEMGGGSTYEARRYRGIRLMQSAYQSMVLTVDLDPLTDLVGTSQWNIILGMSPSTGRELMALECYGNGGAANGTVYKLRQKYTDGSINYTSSSIGATPTKIRFRVTLTKSRQYVAEYSLDSGGSWTTVNLSGEPGTPDDACHGSDNWDIHLGFGMQSARAARASVTIKSITVSGGSVSGL